MATTAILAAPGDFLPILFVLIAIASGIINFVKERRAAANKVNFDSPDFAARGKVNPELQSEIEAFLQEVSPNDFEEVAPVRQGNAAQQRRRRKKNSDEEAERRRQVRARREHEKRQAMEDRKRESVRKRHLETSELSEVSSRHEVANRHVDSSVHNRHLEPQIHAAAASFTELNATNGNSVAQLLRNPVGIRHAILLNEILGPPIANRPGRKSKRL